MKVLSLFDGMSCGQIALERAGIKVEEYYSSEIDKYAMQVTQANYPNTIQVGDVQNIKEDTLPEIDLLIGGSPCQGFSFAGKQLNFEDPRSILFFEFVRLLKTLKPKYFLLENVIMKKEFQEIITNHLEVEPIEINSSLVSAQHRKRLYWTNIPNITQPIDKGIELKDIIIVDSNELKSLKHTEKALKYMNRTVKGGRTHWDFGHFHSICEPKAQCITANIYKGVPYNVIVDKKPNKGEPLKLDSDSTFRKLSPIECERLQTVPDNYTNYVSNTQRYKMLGNGWTVDVITHILKNLD